MTKELRNYRKNPCIHTANQGDLNIIKNIKPNCRIPNLKKLFRMFHISGEKISINI